MKKVTTKEFIWYAACGIVAFLGIIAIVFSIVGYHMQGTNNFIADFEDKIKFSLRYAGLIAIGAALVVFVCALLFNAKKADRDIEKKLRREQRIAAQSNNTIEVKKAVEVIEEKPTEAPKAE